MRRILLFLLIFLAVVVASPIQAHEVRPAYLELRQTGAQTYDVLWKLPAKGELRLGLEVRFPSNCQSETVTQTLLSKGAWIDRWKMTCRGGLGHGEIQVKGLASTLTDTLARVERSDGTVQVARLTASAPSFKIESTLNRTRVAMTYLGLGIEHILLGIDHLLFVLGLILLVKGFGRLVATVTAFTVAHSLTLAAATLDFIHVPQAPVEAAIALSIVFVACELIRERRGEKTLALRWSWLIAFAFGLLHGFGFAGALAEVGLPQTEIPVALLFFNVGVEVGQLAFIAAVFLAMELLKRLRIRIPQWSTATAAYLIGTAASFWMIERIAAF